MKYQEHDQLVFKARKLRKNPTLYEEMLWNRLRRKKLGNLKFRQKHIFSPYLVDYYCASAQIVINLCDSHYDKNLKLNLERTQFLYDKGIHEIWFANWEIDNMLNLVIWKIKKVCLARIALE